MFNYQKICLDPLKDLSPRIKEVIFRRFGFKTGKRETLEAIGRDHGITRERVRQIEKDGFLRMESKVKRHNTSLQKTFQYFADQLKKFGNLKKEDILLSELGGKRWTPQIYFLLTLGPDFKRFGESSELHSLWTINQDSLTLAKKVIDSFYNELKKINQPLSLNDNNLPATITFSCSPSKTALISYLEISKKIQKNPEGLFGLKDWPEINPRGVRDKAYLVFKKTKKPLHFKRVAELIDKSLPQTVHNELIRDDRFVLIGRGIYVLKDWGYEPGQVKDVIFKILKKAEKPLNKEEILEKALQQRLVKENTILLNLSNKKYFLRNSQGEYIIAPKAIYRAKPIIRKA